MAFCLPQTPNGRILLSVLMRWNGHQVQFPKRKAKTMNYVNPEESASRLSKSGYGTFLEMLVLTAALVAPSQASAALTNFSLTWTNSGNSADSFSGTLKVDSELFPSSGMINLAATSATLSITIPQLGGTTYTMADFATFNVGISKAAASNLSVGQNLMSPNLVGKAVIFGKPGSPAYKNFHQCDSEYGVCFNRDGRGPVYNLTSMKVLAPVR